MVAVKFQKTGRINENFGRKMSQSGRGFLKIVALKSCCDLATVCTGVPAAVSTRERGVTLRDSLLLMHHFVGMLLQ
jgi:hypothetical protein